MAQFSFLRVRAVQDGAIHMERFLDFHKFPQIRLSEDLAGSTLFNRISDAHGHGNVYLETLRNGEGTATFLKEHDDVKVMVDVINYVGPYATSMAPQTESVGSVHLKKE
jgi:capsid portal protein